MHTTKTDNFVWHHNGDFSDDVHLIIPDDKSIIERTTVLGGANYYEVRIPFEDLKSLVAEYIRYKFTEALENATNDELILRK